MIKIRLKTHRALAYSHFLYIRISDSSHLINLLHIKANCDFSLSLSLYIISLLLHNTVPTNVHKALKETEKAADEFKNHVLDVSQAKWKKCLDKCFRTPAEVHNHKGEYCEKKSFLMIN